LVNSFNLHFKTIHFFMKQIFTFTVLLCLTLLQIEQLSAQRHGFDYRFNLVNYITPRLESGRFINEMDLSDFRNIYAQSDFKAIELAYNYHLADEKTAFVFPLKVGLARIPVSRIDLGSRQFFGTFDALIQRNLFKQGRFFLNPYIHFGLGTTYSNSNEQWNINIPTGAGLRISLSDNLYGTLQTQYRTASRKQQGWHHGAGLSLIFGEAGESAPPPVTDRDGDGTNDLADACPDEVGSAALNGCPDRDADGIADRDDKCPTTAGVASMMGCPDRDGDGITDADDKCPDAKGAAALMGCPDRDSDGIADIDDKCPDQRGTVTLMGCPEAADSDGDGIADRDDACPREKGTAATQGCPDSDGDTVADKDDSCPKVAGSTAHKGCPDTDKDGVFDDEDRCVDKPGTAANRGCPEISADVKKKLENVVKNVQFETGKSVLLQRSNAVLDEVVKIMKDYPEYSLEISGHTDNVGDAAANQRLSESRAKACFDYLVSKGVAAARMSNAGYGETRPVADNATKSGRDANRRVDFELKVK
jgi:OmpA-OmpF porin, OOP family